MKFILFLTLPLYGLDQLTKRLVLQFINPFDARIVIPDFFTLVNVTNNGAAFGIFKGNNTFFIGISLLALVVVTVLLVRSHGSGCANRTHRRRRRMAARARIVRRSVRQRARAGEYPRPEERAAPLSSGDLVSRLVRVRPQTQRR